MHSFNSWFELDLVGLACALLCTAAVLVGEQHCPLCTPDGLTPASNSLTCTSLAPGSERVLVTTAAPSVGAAALNWLSCTAWYAIVLMKCTVLRVLAVLSVVQNRSITCYCEETSCRLL